LLIIVDLIEPELFLVLYYYYRYYYCPDKDYCTVGPKSDFVKGASSENRMYIFFLKTFARFQKVITIIYTDLVF